MGDSTKWARQFSNSLRRYHSIRAAGPDGTVCTALRRTSLTLGGFCKFTPEVAESFLNALAEQSVRLEAMEVIDALDGVCESPIEMAMSLALWIAAREEVDSVCYLLNGNVYGQTNGERALTIQPQKEIDAYRVDFALMFRAEAEPTREVLFPKPLRRKMIVECDGREFHDSTQEQAVRDRQRDRALQAMGFYVFRYAGSEIWADVFDCAAEAIRVLTSADIDHVAVEVASNGKKKPSAQAFEPLVRAMNG